jgi:hypothetical protein
MHKRRPVGAAVKPLKRGEARLGLARLAGKVSGTMRTQAGGWVGVKLGEKSAHARSLSCAYDTNTKCASDGEWGPQVEEWEEEEKERCSEERDGRNCGDVKGRCVWRRMSWHLWV